MRYCAQLLSSPHQPASARSDTAEAACAGRHAAGQRARSWKPPGTAQVTARLPPLSSNPTGCKVPLQATPLFMFLQTAAHCCVDGVPGKPARLCWQSSRVHRRSVSVLRAQDDRAQTTSAYHRDLYSRQAQAERAWRCSAGRGRCALKDSARCRVVGRPPRAGAPALASSVPAARLGPAASHRRLPSGHPSSLLLWRLVTGPQGSVSRPCISAAAFARLHWVSCPSLTPAGRV